MLILSTLTSTSSVMNILISANWLRPNASGASFSTYKGRTVSYGVKPLSNLSDDQADLIVKDADTVVITAIFDEAMIPTPTISIDVSTDVDADISGAAMTSGGDNTTWMYSWNVPAGHTGDSATVKVEGTYIETNAYAGGDSIIYTIDNTAPTNQDVVFVSSTTKGRGESVTIVSSGEATNDVWFAPSGTTSFIPGITTMS